jgi:hypothetical protein
MVRTPDGAHEIERGDVVAIVEAGPEHAALYCGPLTRVV